MANMIQVCIGIQARSTSGRFPGKVSEIIGGKPMLGHVIDACTAAANYSNRYSFKTKTMVSVALCIPYRDPVGSQFRNHAILIVEGPEDDVLSRYKTLAETQNADYIVRVTGDCPLLPPFLIGKIMTVALKNRLDYVSNVHEDLRTSVDGFDVEVISRRAMDWLFENAKAPTEREHVTLKLRQGEAPPEFRFGHVVGYLDQSNVKLSVDTPDDLERVRAHYDRITRAVSTAERLHGPASVYRY